MNKRIVVKIIEAPYSNAFEKAIQKAMDNGWAALWPMQISNHKFYLAMVRRVNVGEQLPVDETITKQHPDAEKLGDEKK